jgi:FSR family fosmidomycin resistance protein-like MFS transporter
LKMQSNMKSLVATSLAHFVNDGNIYVFITLYPILFPLEYYSLGSTKLPSLFLIGILIALQNAFSVVASPPVGRTADRTGKYRGLLSLGLCLMGIGIAGYALSILFVSGGLLFLTLIPFSIIAGIGGAFYHPLGGSVLSKTWPYRSVGRAMGINGAMGSTGRALFPLLVVSLVTFLAIPGVMVLALLGFVIALLVFIILREVNFFTPTKQTDTVGASKIQERYDDKKIRKHEISILSVIHSILALTIVAFLRGVFSFGVVSFVPEYLESVSGLKYGITLGLALTLVLALPIFGQLFFGTLADKFGRRLVLGITTVGSAMAILLLLYTHDVYLEIILLTLFGFFAFTQFPLLMPLSSNAVPREAATLSNSIVWGIGNSGGNSIGPFLVGLLASPSFLSTLNGAFLIVTIISLLSTPLLLFVPKAQQ